MKLTTIGPVLDILSAMPLQRTPPGSALMRTSTSNDGETTHRDQSVRPKNHHTIGKSFEREFGDIRSTIVEPAIAANNKEAYRQAIKLIDEWFRTVNNDIKDKTETTISEEGPNSVNLKVMSKVRKTAAEAYRTSVDRLEQAIQIMVTTAETMSTPKNKDISTEIMGDITSPERGSNFTTIQNLSPIMTHDSLISLVTPVQNPNSCAEALTSIRGDIQSLTDSLKKILQNDEKNLKE